MCRLLASFLVFTAGCFAAELSPAELSISQARQAIALKPGEAAGYNLLAAGLIRRARETGDDRIYEQAGEAVHHALALRPGNFDDSKLEVMVLLGEHDYTAALAEAKILNKQIPDDVAVYGLLTDAYSALGDYKDAEPAAQWMLNLRPGNLPAFVNASHLREVFGDPSGSYDALALAFQASAPTEIADRASLLTQMGREKRLAGSNEAAEKLFQQALDIFPGYSPALEEQARLYVVEKRFAEAIKLLRQRYEAVPTARNSYDLAIALDLSGNTKGAASEFAEFLRKAQVESGRKNNANLDLVFFYADQAHQAPKALEIAGQEFAMRHDIYTLDAYAWALHANGHDDEARTQMDVALAVGTRDPAILAHAAKIPGSGAVAATR